MLGEAADDRRSGTRPDAAGLETGMDKEGRPARATDMSHPVWSRESAQLELGLPAAARAAVPGAQAAGPASPDDAPLTPRGGGVGEEGLGAWEVDGGTPLRAGRPEFPTALRGSDGTTGRPVATCVAAAPAATAVEVVRWITPPAEATTCPVACAAASPAPAGRARVVSAAAETWRRAVAPASATTATTGRAP
ncbi:MAG: hypothetical protein JWL67_118, partial [Solirubrobacterales bacterium]|nr:hypothetical protein [Solirubrobacterales bacterium]